MFLRGLGALIRGERIAALAASACRAKVKRARHATSKAAQKESVLALPHRLRAQDPKVKDLAEDLGSVKLSHGGVNF